jgi:hypothetical protein
MTGGKSKPSTTSTTATSGPAPAADLSLPSGTYLC